MRFVQNIPFTEPSTVHWIGSVSTDCVEVVKLNATIGCAAVNWNIIGDLLVSVHGAVVFGVALKISVTAPVQLPPGFVIRVPVGYTACRRLKSPFVVVPAV
jgi:hypothetical protein